VTGGRGEWSRRRSVFGGLPSETGRAAAVAGANNGGVAVVEPRKKVGRKMNILSIFQNIDRVPVSPVSVIDQ